MTIRWGRLAAVAVVFAGLTVLAGLAWGWGAAAIILVVLVLLALGSGGLKPFGRYAEQSMKYELGGIRNQPGNTFPDKTRERDDY